MSGPLASWVQEHADPKLTAPDMAVLVTLALDANHLDRLACVAVGELAKLARHDRRTVQRSLARLEAARAIELARAGGGRGRPATYRIPVSFCGCVVCDTLAGLSDKKGRHPAAVSAGGSPSSASRKGGTPSLKGGTRPPTTDGYTPATKQQHLAMQAAKLDLRNGTHTPNGDGRAGTERSVPGHPPAVLGGKAAEDPASQPSPARKEAPAGNLIPFQARSSDGGARRGTARTQSGDQAGATPGDAFSNPRADPEDDDAFWTAGEEAVWQLAQEMRQEPAELFEPADHRDPRRFMR